MEEDLPAPKPVEIFGYSGLLERAATPVMLGAGEEQYGQQQERDNGTTTTETVDPVLASLTSRIDVALGRTQQETDSSVIAAARALAKSSTIIDRAYAAATRAPINASSPMASPPPSQAEEKLGVDVSPHYYMMSPSPPSSDGDGSVGFQSGSRCVALRHSCGATLYEMQSIVSSASVPGQPMFLSQSGTAKLSSSVSGNQIGLALYNDENDNGSDERAQAFIRDIQSKIGIAGGLLDPESENEGKNGKGEGFFQKEQEEQVQVDDYGDDHVEIGDVRDSGENSDEGNHDADSNDDYDNIDHEEGATEFDAGEFTRYGLLSSGHSAREYRYGDDGGDDDNDGRQPLSKSALFVAPLISSHQSKREMSAASILASSAPTENTVRPRRSSLLLHELFTNKLIPTHIAGGSRGIASVDADKVEVTKTLADPKYGTFYNAVMYWVSYFGHPDALQRLKAIKAVQKIIERCASRSGEAQRQDSAQQRRLRSHHPPLAEIQNFLIEKVLPRLATLLWAAPENAIEAAAQHTALSTMALCGPALSSSPTALKALGRFVKQVCASQVALSPTKERLREVIIATGTAALVTIIDLCQDGFDPVDQEMLQLVAAHPAVQEKVLVPIIERELKHGDTGRRSTAVVSLGMLGACATSSLDSLAGVLIDGTVDRRLVALAIRKIFRDSGDDIDGVINKNEEEKSDTPLGRDGVSLLCGVLSACPDNPWISSACAWALGLSSSDVAGTAEVLVGSTIVPTGLGPGLGPGARSLLPHGLPQRIAEEMNSNRAFVGIVGGHSTGSTKGATRRFNDIVLPTDAAFVLRVASGGDGVAQDLAKTIKSSNASIFGPFAWQEKEGKQKRGRVIKSEMGISLLRSSGRHNDRAADDGAGGKDPARTGVWSGTRRRHRRPRPKNSKGKDKNNPTTLAEILMKTGASIVVDARELLTGIKRALSDGATFRPLPPREIGERRSSSLDAEAIAMVADVLATACTNDTAMTRAEAVHSLGKIGFDACASERTLGTLARRLVDNDPKVREVTVEALGKFGSRSLEKVPTAGLSSSRSSTRPWLGTSMSIVGAGSTMPTPPSTRIQDSEATAVVEDWGAEEQIADCSHPVLATLVDMVSKDPFFKVRYVATVTLGNFGPGVAAEAVPVIARAMVGGLIPRDAGAAALAKLGTRGVSALLGLLETGNSTSKSNRTRSRVAAAAGLGRILDDTGNAPTPPATLLDAIVNALYLACRDPMPEVRGTALSSLLRLSRNSRETVTFLRLRSVLPFLYTHLRDPDPATRRAVASALASAGPYGEMLLVEGVLKDENAIVRAAAVNGLGGTVGVRSVRSLLLALQDLDATVRRSAEVALVETGFERLSAAISKKTVAQRKSIALLINSILHAPLHLQMPATAAAAAVAVARAADYQSALGRGRKATAAARRERKRIARTSQGVGAVVAAARNFQHSPEAESLLMEIAAELNV